MEKEKLQIRKIENTESYFTVNWFFIFRCNYDCYYCESHDLISKIPEVDMIRGTHYLYELIKKPLMIGFVGGEPFLYKKLVDVFRVNLPISFRVETNLSAPLKVLERVPTNCDIKATYHPEFADIDEFVKKANYIKSVNSNNQCNIAFPVEEKLWNKALEVYNRVPGSRPIVLQVPSLDWKGSFTKTYDYSDAQKEWLRENTKDIESNLIITTNKGEKLKKNHRFLAINNLLNFKGWKCYAGNNNIHIDPKGDVFPASCFLRTRARLGNVFKENIKLLQHGIKCPFDHCGCFSDTRILKEKI